jgi:hypothetical protein
MATEILLTEREQQGNLDLFELVYPLFSRMCHQPKAVGGCTDYRASRNTDKHLDELMHTLTDFSNELYSTSELCMNEDDLEDAVSSRLREAVRQNTPFGRHVSNLMAIVLGRMLKAVYVGNATPKFDEETLRMAGQHEEIAMCMATLGLNNLWWTYRGLPASPAMTMFKN